MEGLGLGPRSSGRQLLAAMAPFFLVGVGGFVFLETIVFMETVL